MGTASCSAGLLAHAFTLAAPSQGRLAVKPARLLLLMAIPATAVTAVFLWLRATLGDPIVAAIVLGTILVQVLAVVWHGNRR